MDWNHVNILLSVIHQAAAAGPKFAGVAAKAATELDAYMAAPADEVEAEEPVEEEE